MLQLSAAQVLAASYAMLAISGLALVLRFCLRWLRGDPFRLEDFFMLFAFVAFFVLALITIILVPVAYKIIAVGQEQLAYDDSIYGDEVFQLKITFAGNIIFPMVLWSVKLSLLSLSRRILYRLPDWLRGWWMIVGFVVLSYIGCVIVTFTSCVTISDYFTPGACSSARDTRAQIANLYYVVVAEILTDILIMVLPIIFLHEAHLTRAKFLRTVGIFSVGIICIVTAIARGVTIGTRMSVDTPTMPWIAIWQMIEGGIAIVVGCLPTYAVYFIQSWKPTTRKRTTVAYERRLVGHGHICRTFVTTKCPVSLHRTADPENRNSGYMSGGIWINQHFSMAEELRQADKTRIKEISHVSEESYPMEASRSTGESRGSQEPCLPEEAHPAEASRVTWA